MGLNMIQADLTKNCMHLIVVFLHGSPMMYHCSHAAICANPQCMISYSSLILLQSAHN